MIRRSTPKAWWAFFARRRQNCALLTDLMAQQNAFAHQIRKERARCERRSVVSEFALVLIKGAFAEQPVETQKFLESIQSRLRITDEWGWYDQRVTLLLPETDRDGAIHVANWVQKLAQEVGLTVDTDICLYPWDDQWARGSRWLENDSGVGNQPTKSLARVEHKSLEGERISDRASAAPPSATAMSVPFDGEVAELAPSIRIRRTDPFAQPLNETPGWKRVMDAMGAVVGLTLLSPLLAAAAVAIRWDSKGPVLFTQLREGKDGRIFKMYKFRTMLPDAENMQGQLRTKNEQDGPAFKMEDDPRVTRIGRFLRKSCIDELPQLINVLKGDMSLVGPRPLPVSESTACDLWQRRRLSVLPGLTCIWQVSGGRQVSFDQWMRMDLDYAQRRSLLLDTRLLWKTLCLVLRQRGSV